jgi:hypothetical protein
MRSEKARNVPTDYLPTYVRQSQISLQVVFQSHSQTATQWHTLAHST